MQEKEGLEKRDIKKIIQICKKYFVCIDFHCNYISFDGSCLQNNSIIDNTPPHNFVFLLLLFTDICRII